MIKFKQISGKFFVISWIVILALSIILILPTIYNGFWESVLTNESDLARFEFVTNILIYSMLVTGVYFIVLSLLGVYETLTKYKDYYGLD